MREAAALWAVRLSEPSCDAADKAAFEAWRAADPAHEAAYEREAAAWSELDRLRAFRPADGEPDPDLFAPAPDLAVALPRRGRRAAPIAQPRISARRRVAAAVAAIAVAIGGVSAVGVSTLATPAYATGLGERRVVVLSDGTRVELNTNTKVRVRYRDGVREVQLVRGEALFQVAKDVRTFVVRTRGGELRAAGGDEMAVRLADAGPAHVTVMAGHVTAEPDGAPGTVAVPAASATVLRAATSVKAVSSEELDRTLAWRQGAILLNGQSLAEAAAEFNRYNVRQIVIGDAATGELRLGGYFQTSDLTGFVRAVTGAFPVHADAEGDDEIRLSRAS